MFYTRKTPTQIEEFFSDLDSNVPMDILELGISKYDKSQNEFHCAVSIKGSDIDIKNLNCWFLMNRNFLKDSMETR